MADKDTKNKSFLAELLGGDPISFGMAPRPIQAPEEAENEELRKIFEQARTGEEFAEPTLQEIAPELPVVPSLEPAPVTAPTPTPTVLPERQELAARQKAVLSGLQAVQEEDTGARLAALDEAEAQARKAAGEEQQIRQTLQEQLDADLRSLDAKRMELETIKPESFWSKQDTGDKILMGLALIVGGVGQGLAGSRENAAVRMLEKVIDDDFKLQQATFNRKLQALDRQRLSIKEKAAKRQSILTDMQARQEAGLAQFKNTIDRINLRTSNEQAKAKLEQLKLGVDDELLDIREKYQEEVAGKVQAAELKGTLGFTDAGKPQSDAQLKSEGQLLRMTSATDAMQALPQGIQVSKNVQRAVDAMRRAGDVPIIGGFVEAVARITGKDPQSIATGEGKEFLANATEWIRVKLRKESGAAIAAEEWASEYETYFPVAGDRAETVKEKARLRNIVEQSIRVETGRNLPQATRRVKRKGESFTPPATIQGGS